MFVVRDSNEADIPAITRIYAHWVLHGLASFELDPPPESEMAGRRLAVLAGGFPYLVAEHGEHGILGFAYLSPYRARPAYRYSCEDSVYVAPDALSRGVGRALLSALIDRATHAGFRLMVAVIGDSANVASIALHAQAGFQHAGLLAAIGWKHDRWVDSVLMTCALGEGAATAPDERRRSGL